jgi:hypothetical protein
MADEVKLKACPFCGVPLTVRHSVNPSARCDTPGCWMNARMIAVPLDEPRQVAAWNARTPDPGLLAVIREAREALEPFAGCTEHIKPEESDQEWAKFRLLIENYRDAQRALTRLDAILAEHEKGEADAGV